MHAQDLIPALPCTFMPSSYFLLDFGTIVSILMSIADIQFVPALNKIYDGPLGLTPIPPNHPS